MFETTDRMRTGRGPVPATPGRCPRLAWVLAGSFLIAATGRGLAEDTVVLRARDGRTQTRSVGEIVEFTGQALVLRHRSGREEKIDPARVVELKSAWSAEHARGDALREAGEPAEALPHYLTALRGESRGWVRRLILARCVACYRQLEQYERAVQAFLAIDREDPATPYFGAIPLAWTTGVPLVTFERQARAWLQDDRSPAARLSGASWLLSSADRARALQTLRDLTAAAQPSVAFLAEAQLWRTQVVTVEAAAAERWQERIERMPREIRAGPCYLLGQLLARHHRHQEAALAFLRPAILYSEQHDLAAQSLLAAGGQLEKMDQPDDAARLYAEILANYPLASVAEDARRRVKSEE